MRSQAPAATLATLIAASCATVVEVPCKDGSNRLFERYTAEQEARFPAREWILGVGQDTSRPKAEAKAIEAAVGVYTRELRLTTELRTAGPRDDAQDDEAPLLPPDTGPLAVLEASRKAEAYRRLQGPPEEVRNECGRWLAVAAANRGVLDEQLVNEAIPSEARLRAGADAFLGARSWLDAQPIWCAIRAAERDLENLDLRRWSVSRKTVWTDELKRLRASVRAQRKALRARVAVLAERSQDPEADRILEKALRRGEVIADDRPAPACAGAANAIALRPTLLTPCKAGAYVQTCKATLKVVAIACGDEGERVLFTAEAAGEGTDVTDASYARIRAIAEIDPGALVDGVKKQIRARVEAGCPSPGAP